ncbi:hypothetical protein EDD21DRAFT_354635 [Dissophora ornata]|nr:hypothetical protein EDD21DRAFT_354635 [Dissophora ornata]
MIFVGVIKNSILPQYGMRLRWASKVSSGLVSKLKIKNLLQTPVGYKFKTNAPLRYSVKPVLGVLAPGQSVEVFVRCESWVNPQDRFLLQSVALGEDESQQIDAVTWKSLDRRRIIENFIQCSSSSTLSLKEPQDDGGSLSSSSNTSSTRSSVVSSSTLSDKARQQQQQQRAQLNNSQRQTVAHVHAAGRKMSTSSTTSSTTSSPGSYPTLFSSKGGAPSRLPSLKESGQGGNPVALLVVPFGYLTSKLSNSKQTIRTVSQFLAIRQYTKMQVFTVSVVCLMFGLLLPLEKIFMFGSAGAYDTSSTQFRSGIIGHKAAVFAVSSEPLASSSSSSSAGAMPIMVTADQTGPGGEAKNEDAVPVVLKISEIMLDQTASEETRQDEHIMPVVRFEGAL